jgi:hypothetical protein
VRSTAALTYGRAQCAGSHKKRRGTVNLFAQPKGDTKPLAKQLINVWGHSPKCSPLTDRSRAIRESSDQTQKVAGMNDRSAGPKQSRAFPSAYGQHELGQTRGATTDRYRLVQVLMPAATHMEQLAALREEVAAMRAKLQERS